MISAAVSSIERRVTSITGHAMRAKNRFASCTSSRHFLGIDIGCFLVFLQELEPAAADFDLRHARADPYDLAPLTAIHSRLAQRWFDLAAAELLPLGIELRQLPGGAFSLNFVDGAESTAHILHTLDLAVSVGRVMAVDRAHVKPR